MVGMMKKLLVALMTISLLMSMLCVSAMAKEEKKNDKNEHKKGIRYVFFDYGSRRMTSSPLRT